MVVNNNKKLSKEEQTILKRQLIKELFEKTQRSLCEDFSMPMFALGTFGPSCWVEDLNVPIAALHITRNGIPYCCYNPNGIISNLSNLFDNEQHRNMCMAFYILHEAIHYLLNHYIILNDPSWQSKTHSIDILNIAIDLIVNDIIASVLESNYPEFFSILRKEYYFGHETLNLNCSTIPLNDIIEMLNNRITNLTAKKILTNHKYQIQTAPNNRQIEQTIKTIRSAVKTDMEANSNNNNNDNNKIISYEEYKAERFLYSNMKIKIQWHKIIQDITGISCNLGSNKNTHTIDWTRRPHNRIALPNKYGVLPALRLQNQGKLTVFIFIDTSGSINDKQLNIFTNLVKYMPQSMWIIRAFTFSTSVSEIDLTLPNWHDTLSCGGGTNFNEITKRVHEENKHPDNIIVITDGESYVNDNSIKKPKQWTWIIDNKDRFIKFSKLPGHKKTLNSLISKHYIREE